MNSKLRIPLCWKTRIAGNGTNGDSGDGGPAIDAVLGFPRAFADDPIDFWDVVGNLAVDHFGTVYIADSFNNRVRKLTPDGMISAFAGSGQAGNSGDGGLATAATFRETTGVAADGAGNVYVVDSNSRVRKVLPSGVIEAIPGLGAVWGCAEGPSAPCVPSSAAVDLSGNLYVADTGACRVQKLSSDGRVTTVAGYPSPGGGGARCGNGVDGVPATDTLLNGPYGVAVDGFGNIYVADTYNNRIRKISVDGIITTVAGGGYSGDGGPATSAALNRPHGVAVDAVGNIYIADTENFRVRKVSTDGIITTVAGNGAFCCQGGTISASPNPCALSGTVCTSYITWSTTGLSNTEVWVRIGDGADSLFAMATSCTGTDCAAPWIGGDGSIYTFTLYDCSSVMCSYTDHRNALVLSTVRVTAQ